jgi:tetratricopeptide (TPR) repeat protein
MLCAAKRDILNETDSVQKRIVMNVRTRVPALVLCAALAVFGAPAAAAAAPALLEPVFPAENKDLVFVEAEDAVSTNFAREPTLSFDASGLRSLQLNRFTGGDGIGSFYADYAFTVPDGGTWELWYGGTPPGPADANAASYFSPFQYTLDGAAPVVVTQEKDGVTGSYSPGYWWNRVSDLPLVGGRHTLRFEVTQKRRADGRFFFYLDCFFLVKKEGGARVAASPIPSVFPPDLDAAAAPPSFPSLDDALIHVRDAGTSVQPLADIALLYSLLGDYLNALKYLNRAVLLDPANQQVALLAAKNRIWKGDTADGLRGYRDLLQRAPRQRSLWLEAGKVAAWAGRFDESIAFFRGGIALFAGDTDLLVNLGLTLVWAGRGQEAEVVFRQAEDAAAGDVVKLKDIARAYRVNGAADRALKAYAAAIKADPRDLASYLLVAETLDGLGRTTDAADALARVTATFAPSDRLSSALAAFTERDGLKTQVMAQYRAALDTTPDNLVLRQLLAQTYFWNGLKASALVQYRTIIDTHAWLAVRAMENGAGPLLSATDTAAVLRDWLTRAPSLAQKARAALSAQQQKLTQASAARDTAARNLDKAKAAETAAQGGKTADAAAAARQAAEDALVAAETAVQSAGDALALAAAQASALAARAADVGTRVSGVESSLADLRTADAAAEEELARAVRGTSWRFDRTAVMAELTRDAPDSPLARLLAARMSLMDGQAAAVETMLAPIAAAGATDTTLLLARGRLAAGKVADAAPLLQQLAGGTAVDMPSWVPALAQVQAAFAAEPVAEGDGTADAVAAAAQAVRDLASFESTATALQDRLAKASTQLRVLYRHALARAFHSFDEEVVGLRNDLGDYYLAGDTPLLDDAIQQFRKVLAVAPGDLAATFRLGKVYQWKGDWKSALDAYALVYAADPGYENVSALYNEVERAHADTVSSVASYLAEPQRSLWHAEASWSLPLTSAAGLSLLYQSDAVRINRPVAGDTITTSYQLHDLSVGLPLSFGDGAVTVTPGLGGIVAPSGLTQIYDASGVLVGGTNLFGVYAAEPYAKVYASLSVLTTLYLSGTGRWGRQPETWDPARSAVYDASAEASLTTLLSFIDAWPLHDTSLRTYARLDYLHHADLAYENAILTGLQEVSINVLKGGDPYGLLTVTGTVTFQHSDRTGSVDYYAPPDVLSAGASFTGSTWIGVGGGDVLGLSARLYAGPYVEDALSAAPLSRIKGEAQVDVSLAHGSGTWTASAVANATYNAALVQPWDYWSLSMRLGYSAKLPRLLAP